MVPSADKSIVRLWDDPNRRELSSVVDGKIAGFEDGRQITIFYPTSFGESDAPAPDDWCRTKWENIPTAPDQIKAILIKASDQAAFRVGLGTYRVPVKNGAWYTLDFADVRVRQTIISQDGSWQTKTKINSEDGQSTTVEVLTRKAR